MYTDVHKLDMAEVKHAIQNNRKCSRSWSIETVQVAIYIMAGGGLIGRFFAEQPADAYRDARAGRAPYPAKAVENMRKVLVAMAEVYGLDPHYLPPIPAFHHAGVF
jgi:hypothetical protein